MLVSPDASSLSAGALTVVNEVLFQFDHLEQSLEVTSLAEAMEHVLWGRASTMGE